MRGNRGRTSLRRRRRTEDPMREYDSLPPELRAWLATAVLPWRPRSVRRAFDNALARTGDAAGALRELDHLQQKLITKDARSIWGQDYPRPAIGAEPIAPRRVPAR